ncbi:endonuclease domain-containing protein [Methyloceanibacter sp.]|uniref:endonuclease domain-containing protein n=1 Tax=Methyloceanibacter sp. TaxID=1965321 RepID=UPI003D6CD0B8
MPHAAVSDGRRRRAKAFRRQMTTAERKLWYALKAHRFEGLGFRRQVPLGRYVLDFVCHERGLVVEVDGGQHFSALRAGRYAIRDRWLHAQGYRVANNEVINNLSGVLEYLLSVDANSPLPPCGGARPRFARSEGGEARTQSKPKTPLPTLPHKGGGGTAEPSVENSRASESSVVAR